MSVSCTENIYNNTSICIATGYSGNSQNTGTPLVMQNINSGAAWTRVSISSVMNFGVFRKASCSSTTTVHNTTPGTCIAVGWGTQNQSKIMD